MKRSETRSLIINTASDLFYRQGYNLTGINEIIAKAGIAKATLYSHFKSKEDLCIAYLKARDEELLISIDEFCQERATGEEQLLGVLHYLIPFFQSGHFNGCWCIRTVAEIPLDNQRIRQTIRENKKAFQAYIHQLVQKNKPDLAEEEQSRLSKRIYLLYESAVAESHLQGAAWPIHEAIDMLNSFLKPKITA